MYNRHYRVLQQTLVALTISLGAGVAHATPIPLNEIINDTATATSAYATGPFLPLGTTGSSFFPNAAVADGLFDAFDGYGMLRNPGIGGLEVARQVNTLEASRTYRLLDIFSNTTAAPITTTLNYYTNLGSDGLENIVEEGPNRSITFQDYLPQDGSPDYDPVIAFTYGSAFNARGDVFSNSFDLFFDITVNANSSLGLVQYATLIRDDTNRSSDVATANAYSTSLLLSPDYSGLSSQQIASIGNFSSPSEVPEPNSFALLGIGFLAFGFRTLRRLRFE